MFKCGLMRLKSFDQNDPVNLVSQSLTMFWGTPQYFTTFLKKMKVVSSAKHCFGIGINVAYLENLSTTTNILVKSPVFQGWWWNQSRHSPMVCSIEVTAVVILGASTYQFCLISRWDRSSYTPPHILYLWPIVPLHQKGMHSIPPWMTRP